MTMTGGAGKAPQHWPFLDFLRATAALLVLLAHSRASYFVDIKVADQDGVFLTLFYFITGLGHQAVVIFFVLSGFLIGGSLTDSMQRGSFNPARYLIARFVRIYIVYFPALVIAEVIFLFGLLLPSGPMFEFRELNFGGVSQAICFLSGLQGFACAPWAQDPPLWSLGYEWALYLFAPPIIQLAVWKASPGLRLMGIVLSFAIVLTVCRNPAEAVFWFSAWFLGAAAYHVLRVRRVPLQAGLLGAGLMFAGIALQHVRGTPDLMTDSTIAAGAAIAVACRPLVAFPLAPRFFGWVAGFSYTIYAIHMPFIYLIHSIFQSGGFPVDDVPPSPVAFMELGVTIPICLLAAFLTSLITERKTGQVRAALLRMCPPRTDREPGSQERALFKEAIPAIGE